MKKYTKGKDIIITDGHNKKLEDRLQKTGWKGKKVKGDVISLMMKEVMKS